MRVVLALVIPAVIAALIGLSSWAGDREANVRTVSGISVVGDRVYVGIGGEVWIADPSGRVLGHLSRADGSPWSGGTVTGVSPGPDGTLLVAANELHQLIRFDGEGRELGPWKLPFTPKLRFYAVWAGDRLIVADTMANRIAAVDQEGALLASRSVRYPNGLLFADKPAPEVLLVGTYQHLAFALDPKLARADDARIQRLNALLESRFGPFGFPHVLGLTAAPDGTLVTSLCRTTDGDCAFYRAGGPGDGIIADTGAIAPSDALDPDLMMAVDAALTPSGALLVASARAGSVLIYSDGQGGPPAAGFCLRCTNKELQAHARGLEALRNGLEWPNGTRVARFGDAALQARYDQIAAESAHYRFLGALARGGLYLLVGLLLLALLVARSFGIRLGAPVPPQARQVWAELIVPATRELVAPLAGLALVLGGAAAIGGLVLGWAGALALAAAAGLLASRTRLTPWVVHHAPPERATASWQLFHGSSAPRPVALLEGEVVEHCAFALPVLEKKELAGELAVVATVEDPLEFLHLVFPTPLLFVRTNRRLFLSRVTPWGTPVGELVSLEIVELRGGPRGFAVVRQPGGTACFELGERSGSPGALIATAAPVRHCATCGAASHACSHKPLSTAVALAASALFPGFGQLAQRRFSAGRGFALAGLAMLAATLHAYLPQLWGTLPWNPTAIIAPASMFALVWLAGLAELCAFARLERRRAQCYRGS